MTEVGSVPEDVAGFLANVENKTRREDARRLLTLMREVSGEKPRLWGSMIGFGDCHYRYESGREGDTFKIGFAPRKANLVLYTMSGTAGHADLLTKLGPHKTGKSCVYIKRLDDLDESVLVELLRRSLAHVDRVADDRGGLPRMSENPPP